jgi:HlyD family secretion protein
MSLNAAPARRKSKFPWVLVAWIVAAAVILVGGGAWLLRPKAPKDPYRTEQVTRGDITRSVSASGSLQALVTVQVGSQISGQITKVLADFNDRVTKGQVMAILDPQTYVSRAEQGRADIAASQASVAQLQAQAEVARANYNRTKTLYDKGIAAKAALDTDQAAWKSAQASVAAGQARVTQSRAALSATEIDLGRTTIVAPIAGVVVDRQIEPGQTVAASLSAPILFQIAQDLTRLEVKISVDEADIGQVQEGQAVKFTVDAFPDDNFTGVVTQVRKQPETSANVVAYTVIAEADNPGGKLLPGMTANADIVIERRPGVLRVPAAALRWTPADQSSSGQRAGGGAGGGFGGAQGGGQRQGGQGGQGGGQGGARGMTRVLDGLNLDAGQKAKAEAIFAEARQKGAAAAAGATDQQSRRKAMRATTDAAFAKLEPILKPDQKAKLVALRARMAQGGGRGQGGMTTGVVWIMKDNKPTPVQVMVGATDGSFTEIVDRSGALKEGAEVITGGGPKAKVQARSPLGGAGGGVRVRM